MKRPPRFQHFGLVLILVAPMASPVLAADEVRLAPLDKLGDLGQVTIDLKAEGKFIPNPAPSAAGEKASGGQASGAGAKPLDLKVELRLEFAEKVLEVNGEGAATRSVRRVTRAGSALNGQIRPTSNSVRPEVSLLVANLGPSQELTVFSPSGPLYRSELEVVQGPCDPLLLPAFLPNRAIKIGDEWNLGNLAAKAVTYYDALASNSLVARLESADEFQAKVTIRGTVRGALMGAEGTVECEGSYSFNRKSGRISSFTLNRTEKRKAGQVEAGLDVKSTLTVTRAALSSSAELSEEFLSKLSLTPSPEAELLAFRSPDGRFSLVHDRMWHIAWDSDRVSVLKRIDRGGDLVAQCNLQLGPNLGKGKHQDPKQFREDLRRGLGKRFVAILGEGEIEAPAEGGYRYRVAVQGREGDVGVIWYYYLVASPGGDQLLVTFTLGQNEMKSFGNQDLQLIGSLEWAGAAR